MNTDSKLVELGYCGRPHGIKGGFSLVLYNPEDSVLSKGMSVVLVPSSENSSLDPKGELYEISNIQIGHKSILYLKGVDDRNSVEEIIPFKIFLSRDKFPALEQGEFYLSDLIGVEAFNEAGKRVGEIVSMYDNGAQSVVVIETKNKDEIELPLVDSFFVEIDIENNKVIIRPPELI